MTVVGLLRILRDCSDGDEVVIRYQDEYPLPARASDYPVVRVVVVNGRVYLVSGERGELAREYFFDE